MTRKEFKEHDWKVGERLYVIKNNEFKNYSIPHKVERVYVRRVCADAIWVSKKNEPCYYNGNYIYCTDRSLPELFFTRKDALESFDKKQQEFIAKHRDRVARGLVNMRYCVMKRAWGEWAKINSMLRMNIMNK